MPRNRRLRVLWPTLRLGHRATPSTICLHLLYPHRFLASFLMLLWPLCLWSFFSLSSLSPVFVIRPGDRTIFLFMIYLLSFFSLSFLVWYVLSLCSWSIFSLSHSLSPVRDPSRWSYYLSVHDLSSLSHFTSFLSRLYIAVRLLVVL